MVIDENTFEDIIEQAFWEFDSLTKNKEFRFESHRDLFKRACREAKNKVILDEENL